MKKIYLPLITVLLFISACRNHTPAPQQPENPKALQENNTGFSVVSKSRSNDNLVEALYNELVEKTPALDSLEKSIEEVTESKSDSVAAFNLFNQKNQSFYNEAAAYTGRITDTAVKQQIKKLLDNSNGNYGNKTAAYNRLLETIAQKATRLNDLHIVLKLVKTLSVMEKYQDENLPSLQPLQQLSTQYDKTISQTASAGKQ